MDQPSQSCLLEVPASAIPNLFICVRCGEIPDPDYMYSCGKGHYTCGDCTNAVKKPVDKSDNVEGRKRACLVEPCCEKLTTLRRETPFPWKTLLAQSLFRCRYHERGCSRTMIGSEKFFEHLRNCLFGSLYNCRHHECTEKRASVMELLEHFEKDHEGPVLPVPANGQIILPINFTESIKQRLCAILGFEDKHFIFATEILDGMLFMWIWDLNHDSVNDGKNTNFSYQLNLKIARKGTTTKDPQNLDELSTFQGDCLFHSVQRYDIMRSLGVLVDTFKMRFRTFVRFFVFDTVRGDGKWFVKIALKEKDQKEEKKGLNYFDLDEGKGLL